MFVALHAHLRHNASILLGRASLTVAAIDDLRLNKADDEQKSPSRVLPLMIHEPLIPLALQIDKINQLLDKRMRLSAWL